jgi:hypothetical protein
METAKAIAQIGVGEVLATGPAADPNIRAWAKRMGQKVASSEPPSILVRINQPLDAADGPQRPSHLTGAEGRPRKQLYPLQSEAGPLEESLGDRSRRSPSMINFSSDPGYLLDPL